jgi:ferredoxin
MPQHHDNSRSSSKPAAGNELDPKALRKWFHSSVFNSSDGLDDYDQDFNTFQPLKDILTADMRHHMERHRKDRQKTNSEQTDSEIDPKGSVRTPDQKDLTAMLPDAENVQQQASTLKLASRGRVLIIGPEAKVIECGLRLDDRLEDVLLVDSDEYADCRYIQVSGNRTMPMVRGKIRRIEGFLGEFYPTVMMNGVECSVTSLTNMNGESVDLVLDLDSPPHMSCERPPLGYFAPGNDPEALDQMLTELPDMVGEFEKPVFISQVPDLCAHHLSGFTGCTRCIDCCPSGAVRSKDHGVEIDHFMCQGCGLCAAVCPTGALKNKDIQIGELLNVVRQQLQSFEPADSVNASVVFHEPETSPRLLMQISSQWPGPVIRQSVRDIGAVGMDIWLVLLALGADRIILVSTPQTTQGMRQTIMKQAGYASTILHGMGYPSNRVILTDGAFRATKTEFEFDKSEHPESSRSGRAAAAVPVQDKREMMRFAVGHLYDQSPRSRSEVPLPEDAPFGAIRVDRDACTFCMACAQACPVSAIEGGTDQPQINFIEARCIQCGLCRRVCPEMAVALFPRMVYERKLSESKNILNMEDAFNCISCGKPFAPARLIERMAARLTGHWMYKNLTELRRLKMCRNCRLQDLFDRQPSEDIP